VSCTDHRRSAGVPSALSSTWKSVSRQTPGRNTGSALASDSAIAFRPAFADDQIIGVFADKLHLFEPGSTYQIEYTETVSSGVTYRNVKSATAVAAPAAPANAAPAAGFNTYRETSANDAKRMFVCANLSALIRAGEVKNDKASLWNATQLLCALWDHTFGEAGTFRASEAQRARAHV
jgi:hypothetical protein